MNTFNPEDRPAPFKIQSLDSSPLRTYFNKTDTVVMRGQPLNQPQGSGARFDMTIKGGGNGAHSHNDLGSYAIALDGAVTFGDPGGPAYYNASTGLFRYQSPLLGSYGHPVPLINGKFQEEALAVLREGHLPAELSTSDIMDQFKVELTRAYNVGDKLSKVTRVAKLSREGAGAVILTDTVEYKNIGSTVQ
ncbi:hypothetical protein HDU96_009097 [Phlyctochytrium bullatum]|nr:hypothetical protein HDU96_009097 [Phlyctochytrium bullatum]